MKLDKVSLQNFRSYESRIFEFGEATVVIGENGVGKSNLLESIYLLATGKSFRADSETEMILYERSHARVIGEGEEKIEILLTDGSFQGARKKYFINGVSRRMIDFVGKFRAVLFGPGDMELLTGSPSHRRRYVDFVICQKNREYRRCLLSYEKGLRQRNRLLDLIKEGKAGRHQLFFWDRLLIKNGEYLTQWRSNFLHDLGHDGRFSVLYDKSVISESRLKQYEVEEVAAGSTLVGPHRDDFVVLMNSRDVSKFGSRGEQRMALLWLKLGERDYLTEGEELPTLLLDDIFSELDHKHREEVVILVKDQLKRGGRVIMTTADEHLIPEMTELKKTLLK